MSAGHSRFPKNSLQSIIKGPASNVLTLDHAECESHRVKSEQTLQSLPLSCLHWKMYTEMHIHYNPST